MFKKKNNEELRNKLNEEISNIERELSLLEATPKKKELEKKFEMVISDLKRSLEQLENKKQSKFKRIGFNWWIK